MKTIKNLEAQLLFETKQSNQFRLRRNKATTAVKKKSWQTLIDLADENKNKIKKQIETMKTAGLKKPTVRGLKKVCSHVVRATGLKVDGTLKKGYKYIKGGKVVKTAAAPKKKVIAKKKPTAKKPAVKKPAVKKPVAKRKPTARKTTAKTK